MKTTFSILLTFIITNLFAQQLSVSSGKIQRFENFKSNYVDERNIDVWLPDGYSDKEKYVVLYMHDGQMLYDATTTWNKQEWQVDEVASKLITENKTKKFIVVGIWNNGSKRHVEYFPQKPFERLTQVEKDTVTAQLKKANRTDTDFKPVSNDYLKFLVAELKPFIDKTFSTKKDRKNTFIAGSSMGGLISMYAICEYPDVFGGAACMSTHWPGTFSIKNNPVPNVVLDYLKNNLPNPKNHKIYFDYGDKTLDAKYKPYQELADKIMIEKGYTAKNWITKFFAGNDHSEKSWASRFHFPLEFLLEK